MPWGRIEVDWETPDDQTLRCWKDEEYATGYLEKPAPLAFRGTLRDLSIGERVINQRLTLQMIISLPPNPHPVEVFRGTLQNMVPMALRSFLFPSFLTGR